MVRFLTVSFFRSQSAREALSDEQTTPVVCEEFKPTRLVAGKKQQKSPIFESPTTWNRDRKQRPQQKQPSQPGVPPGPHTTLTPAREGTRETDTHLKDIPHQKEVLWLWGSLCLIVCWRRLLLMRGSIIFACGEDRDALTSMEPHISSRENISSYLFLTVIQGEGYLTYRGKKHFIRAGDCVYINCRNQYAHESTAEHPWTLMWVHFNGNGADDFYKAYQEQDRGRFFIRPMPRPLRIV